MTLRPRQGASIPVSDLQRASHPQRALTLHRGRASGPAGAVPPRRLREQDEINVPESAALELIDQPRPSKRHTLSRSLLPQDLPDPCVVRADGVYWVYTTNSVTMGNVPLLRTGDLQQTLTYVCDAMPTLPAWAQRGLTWAPEVTRLPNGGFALYFTARLIGTGVQVIGCALSDSPQGPFIAADRPMIEMRALGGAIDAGTLVREDGTAYLYWKNDGNAVGLPTTLWGAQLSPCGRFIGCARPLLGASHEWECELVEAPQVIEEGDHFHLIYACGEYDNASYAQGHAVGASPLGPFRKSTEPLLATVGALHGPGHACAFRDHAGEWHLMYHAWTRGAVGYKAKGKRTLRLSRLRIQGERVWTEG
ncbi:glycoside hydrolase family 43 protein [Deinococcus humi]|uniref:Beta-xylosidase n=1 Tax=Deinococcus humi TaxID=662880 RepID=A0A7W8K1K4_9DEIO|nr:glycoside hydrolase family 43 protein [Deinococcus humi]MBB5365898.1 beta-xylosidase [Deinococcus humi]